MEKSEKLKLKKEISKLERLFSNFEIDGSDETWKFIESLYKIICNLRNFLNERKPLSGNSEA